MRFEPNALTFLQTSHEPDILGIDSFRGHIVTEKPPFVFCEEVEVQMSRWVCLHVVFLLSFQVSGVLAQEPEPAAPLIRSVHVARDDVFPNITGRPRFLYRWANALHVITKESVVRREILFRAGQQLDLDLLDESERRLRRLPYLGAVAITIDSIAVDSIDITVVTSDQWTTLTSTILSSGGGRTTYGGALEEFNLLGYGKQFFAEASHEKSEGTTLTFRYRDPQLLSSRWTAEANIVDGPFAQVFSGQIVRPFFSPDTKWAWRVEGVDSDRIRREFDSGRESNRFRRRVSSILFAGERAFGARYRKTRLRLAYQFQDRAFSAVPGTATMLPESELIHRTAARLRIERLAFTEETRIDRFLKTEDITLGSITTFGLGRTGLPAPNGVKRFELLLARHQVHQIAADQYLFATAAMQTFFEKETRLNLRLRYYNRMMSWQTLALNAEFDYAKDTEEVPFVLGGDSGLRGFPARQFPGNKRLLLNLEDRFFTPLKILTVAIGGVIFADAGNVWQESQTVGFSDINLSVGVGLRLGYTKSPNSRVGRIDFALPVRGDHGLGITVGIDQQFSMN